MNKKLLLSFAVFSTALSLNAQNSVYKGFARRSVNTEFVTNSVFATNSEINPVNVAKVSGNKRLVSKTVTDTLSIAGNKKTYGHPHQAYNTNRTMKLKMYKSGNDTEFLSANQRYDNTQPLKLNSFGVSLTAYHDNTPVVALVILRSKNSNKLDSIVPVEMNINRVNSGSGNPTSSTRWFTPSSPISITDTFMIEVLPASETDSVGVTASGAYYGSTRAVAKIDGTTLTVNSAFQNDSTFAGWAIDTYGYFKGGFFAWSAPFNNFFISGDGVLPGTYIVGQTGQFTYTVNQAQTVAETNISQDLKTYNSFAGMLGVNSNKGGQQTFDYYSAFDDGTKALESDWLMYPAVEYTVESDPKANDVCKGDDGSVSITFDANNRNVLENPVLNKLAFFQNYLGFDKALNYFYSTVQNGKGSTKFVELLDFKAQSLTVETKLDSLQNVDTLFVVDYILPYGFAKNANTVTMGHTFYVSNKVEATTTVLTPAHINTNDGQVVVVATGGYAPYTYAWDNNETNDTINVGVGTYNVVVTDANGCSAASASAVVELSSVAELGLTNVVVYPNPVKEVLNVKFDSKTAATVELVNVAGQVLDSKTSSNVSFNTADLGAGVYFVNIKVAEGVYTQKIIKD